MGHLFKQGSVVGRQLTDHGCQLVVCLGRGCVTELTTQSLSFFDQGVELLSPHIDLLVQFFEKRCVNFRKPILVDQIDLGLTIFFEGDRLFSY